MRGRVDLQESMLSYFSPDSRVPEDHPLRRNKQHADTVLDSMNPEFDRIRAEIGRLSIPPERLFKASLIAPHFAQIEGRSTPGLDARTTRHASYAVSQRKRKRVEKLKGTRLRYFFKEALRDFLPPEVIVKRKQEFGLPVGPWLESHRPFAELARVSCDGLRECGIVRGDFLDWLWREGSRGTPAYYGVMGWALMMLGQWLASRRAA